MRFTRWILCGALSAVYAFGAATTGGVGLQPGSLPAGWRSGGPSCVTVPDWQVHEYNEDFYILRESGCIHFEKPFLYLIFGAQHALLEDTGAGDVQTAPFVASAMKLRAKNAKITTTTRPNAMKSVS